MVKEGFPFAKTVMPTHAKLVFNADVTVAHPCVPADHAEVFAVRTGGQLVLLPRLSLDQRR